MKYCIILKLLDNLSFQVIIEDPSAIQTEIECLADTHKGLRPSFSKAADPKEALPLYEYFIQYLSGQYSKVKTGVFGAKMEVGLVNDGPLLLLC